TAKPILASPLFVTRLRLRRERNAETRRTVARRGLAVTRRGVAASVTGGPVRRTNACRAGLGCLAIERCVGAEARSHHIFRTVCVITGVADIPRLNGTADPLRSIALVTVETALGRARRHARAAIRWRRTIGNADPCGCRQALLHTMQLLPAL